MNTRIKTLACLTSAIVLSSVNPVVAGGCGGGGGRASIGRAVVSHIAHRQPSINYQAPRVAHSNPVYANNPAHYAPQPQFAQHPQYAQPAYPQQFPTQQLPQQHVSQMPQTSNMQQGGFAQNGAPQQFQNDPFQNQPQQFAGQPQQNPTRPNTANQQLQNQQVQGQQVQNQQFANQQQPNGRNQNAQAQNAQVAQQARPTQQNSMASVAPSSGGQLGTSALELLASIESAPQTEVAAQQEFAIPDFTSAAFQSEATHVGLWTVALPGNQSIALTLNSDNSFSWNASKDGQSSTFEGQYRLEDGRLTLVRSNDLQQMSGSWSDEGTNSVFKLDGATNSGLSFARNQ